MRQGEYSVIISQSYNIANNELGTPIVLALVKHEHDTKYLKEAVDSVCDSIVRGGFYYENSALQREWIGSVATFESADGSKQIAVYVSTPYDGWNL